MFSGRNLSVALVFTALQLHDCCCFEYWCFTDVAVKIQTSSLLDCKLLPEKECKIKINFWLELTKKDKMQYKISDRFGHALSNALSTDNPRESNLKLIIFQAQLFDKFICFSQIFFAQNDQHKKLHN